MANANGQVRAHRSDSSDVTSEQTVVKERFDLGPVISFKPQIRFPQELLSHSSEARVYVNILIDSAGDVCSANILKSTDSLFNKYALSYAWKYKFSWQDSAAQSLISRFKKVWNVIPIHFTK